MNLSPNQTRPSAISLKSSETVAISSATTEEYYDSQIFCVASTSSSTDYTLDVSPLHNIARLDPVTSRRLWKLKTFQGEAEIGYAKPNAGAVAAVSVVLNAVYSFSSGIKSPAVSPSPEGEVLLSWRTKSAYLILQFLDGSEFEWAFKLDTPISGKADVNDVNTQRSLTAILHYLYNPTSLPEVSQTSSFVGYTGPTSMLPEQHRQLIISV